MYLVCVRVVGGCVHGCGYARVGVGVCVYVVKWVYSYGFVSALGSYKMGHHK